MSLRIVLTGPPASGKTTLVKKIVKIYPFCGFYTEEVREGGKRVGFDIVCVRSGERRPLSRTGVLGPRVGRYGVLVESVEWALGCLDCKIVVVDEIGPMELKHPRFKEAVLEAARTSEIFLSTVHRSLWKEWKEMLNARVFYLTRERWEEVFREVSNLLSSHFSLDIM